MHIIDCNVHAMAWHGTGKKKYARFEYEAKCIQCVCVFLVFSLVLYSKSGLYIVWCFFYSLFFLTWSKFIAYFRSFNTLDNISLKNRFSVYGRLVSWLASYCCCLSLWFAFIVEKRSNARDCAAAAAAVAAMLVIWLVVIWRPAMQFPIIS